MIVKQTYRAVLLGLFAALPAFAVLVDTDETATIDKEVIDVRFDSTLMEELPAAIYEASLDVQDDPENPDNWIRIGDIYLLSEKPAQASSAYWRAARLDPGHPKALENLGVCFLNMRDYEHAEKIFEALLEKEPDNIPALLNAGAAYHGQGKYAEAELTFESVVARDPKNYNAIYNLAVIKVLTDRVEEGIELFKEAYRTNPKSPFSLFAAARGHARLEQPTEMFQLLEKGLKQVPNDQRPLILGHPAFAPWSNTREFKDLLRPAPR